MDQAVDNQDVAVKSSPGGTGVKSSAEHLLMPHLRGYNGASNLAFNEVVKKKRESGQKIHHLAFGQSPFPVMEGAKGALQSNAGQAAYLEVAGLFKLREAICQFHKRHDNISHFSPNDIVVGPGSKELLFLLLNIFNGDVLLLSPCWTTYKPQAMFLEKRTFTISTSFENDWKLTPELVENCLEENDVHPNRILIMCNPDNPTGTGYTSTELEALSSCFRKNKVLVISDEIYARLHYDNQHETIVKHYPEGTVLSTGISKWASAGGWRLGYQVFPEELACLRKAVTSAASHTYSCAPSPVQYAALWLFSNDIETTEYISHCRRILATVADYCYRRLSSVGVKVMAPKAGFYMFPDFEVLRGPLLTKGIETCQQMCNYLLKERNIALMAGGPAFLRPEKELTVRLCFIDFDGTEPLKESYKYGLNRPLDQDFLAKHCTWVYLAINEIAEWVEETKQLIIMK